MLGPLHPCGHLNLPFVSLNDEDLDCMMGAIFCNDEVPGSLVAALQGWPEINFAEFQRRLACTATEELDSADCNTTIEHVLFWELARDPKIMAIVEPWAGLSVSKTRELASTKPWRTHLFEFMYFKDAVVDFALDARGHKVTVHHLPDATDTLFSTGTWDNRVLCDIGRIASLSDRFAVEHYFVSDEPRPWKIVVRQPLYQPRGCPLPMISCAKPIASCEDLGTLVRELPYASDAVLESCFGTWTDVATGFTFVGSFVWGDFVLPCALSLLLDVRRPTSGPLTLLGNHLASNFFVAGRSGGARLTLDKEAGEVLLELWNKPCLPKILQAITRELRWRRRWPVLRALLLLRAGRAEPRAATRRDAKRHDIGDKELQKAATSAHLALRLDFGVLANIFGFV
mmetsp:Transcript_59334/g.165672  ORF Transcript_59334/g.165672 Transcript_59334/m.165672 type:complete len:399 (+) Transcript_59334:78-1274(+)